MGRNVQRDLISYGAEKMEAITKEDKVVESVEQFASAWKVLVGDRPGANLTDRPGLSDKLGR
jgi:hypothetical protein